MWKAQEWKPSADIIGWKPFHKDHQAVDVLVNYHGIFFEFDPFGGLSFCLSFLSPDCERGMPNYCFVLFGWNRGKFVAKHYKLFCLVWFLAQMLYHHHVIKSCVSLWATSAFDGQNWWKWKSINWYDFWSNVQDDKPIINNNKNWILKKNKKLFQCNNK